MNRRVRHLVTPDQLVLAVNAHVVLVAIVTLAVLLRPARLRVLLPTFGRLVGPGLGVSPRLICSFSSRRLRWMGTATIDASMIWPAAHGLKALAFEIASKSSNRVSIIPACDNCSR